VAADLRGRVSTLGSHWQFDAGASHLLPELTKSVAKAVISRGKSLAISGPDLNE
jgi:hypothetical protein